MTLQVFDRKSEQNVSACLLKKVEIILVAGNQTLRNESKKNLRCLFKEIIASKCFQFRVPQEKNDYWMFSTSSMKTG